MASVQSLKLPLHNVTPSIPGLKNYLQFVNVTGNYINLAWLHDLQRYNVLSNLLHLSH